MFLNSNKLRQLLHRFRGRSVEFNLKPYRKLLAEVNELEREFESVGDRLLKERSMNLIRRAREGVSLNEILVEAFALVREVSMRILGLRPFDVQIIAGIAMHQGKLVEMQTGEGKTLVAVLSAYLNALAGRGVHILTFNDYLARRDADWMGPIYKFLGLTVGFVQEGMSTHERREAYSSDITYGTVKEVGFDYLRDHLCYEKEYLVQHPFHYAIVDEADSNLIDEALVPLVIAGSTITQEANLTNMAEIARKLKKGIDFNTDEYSRNIHLTDAGYDRVEAILDCGGLHDPENHQLLSELNLSLHAEVLLKCDDDYIVRNGKVELVDEFTGRVVENRHWPNGLQGALERKEGLQVQPEGMILGSITLQHFLKLYPKVSGMTATAVSAAEEFEEFYNLKVVVIPSNRFCIRIDHPDVLFTHKEAKNKALIEEITRAHRTGQPILVGTSSIGESERLAAALQKESISCQVLNAKNDELEAEIIAQAGSPGAVTISTNMAGRGTDIRLGGDKQRDWDKVVASGGLYVIGTNRHQSRRIDNQLRGRAGRQADPGESRFFISLEDDLIERFGVEKLIPEQHRLAKRDNAIDDPVFSREVARTQRIIEGQSFEIRRSLWKYSSLIEEQRKIIHQRRQDILLDKVPLRFLAKQVPQRYSKLHADVGERILHDVEKKITLFHIDRCWAEHLTRIAHIREGTHLFSVGGQNPLDEFHKTATKAFADLQRKIDDEIIKTFNSAKITEAGIDMDKEGLKGPSSTWTYLINDNPFGDWIERFAKGFKKLLIGTSA